MSFQRIVLHVSIFILLIMLLILGYLIYKQQTTYKWPPEISQCPDYWKVTGPNQCENVLGVGNMSSDNCRRMNFDGADYKGANGFRNKAAWAESCGVYWDGISDKRYLEEEADIVQGNAGNSLTTFGDILSETIDKYNESP